MFFNTLRIIMPGFPHQPPLGQYVDLKLPQKAQDMPLLLCRSRSSNPDTIMTQTIQLQVTPISIQQLVNKNKNQELRRQYVSGRIALIKMQVESQFQRIYSKVFQIKKQGKRTMIVKTFIKAKDFINLRSQDYSPNQLFKWDPPSHQQQLELCRNNLLKRMQTDMEDITPYDARRTQKSDSPPIFADDFCIQQFLNQEAFVEYKYDKNPRNPQQNIEKPETGAFEADQKDLDETSKKTKRKSIFHNFQKHLITLLKKHFRIGLKTFEGQQDCHLAFSLWHAFSKTKSYNKKILHIIFGIQETTQLHTQYDALAYQFKEFRTIKNKHSIHNITKAQDLIRTEVVSQSRAVNRLLLEANCNVSRLQLFWEYFNSFIDELREGPMVKRMTKQQKGRLIEKYAGTSKLN